MCASSILAGASPLPHISPYFPEATKQPGQSMQKDKAYRFFRFSFYSDYIPAYDLHPNVSAQTRQPEARDPQRIPRARPERRGNGNFPICQSVTLRKFHAPPGLRAPDCLVLLVSERLIK